MKSDINRQLLIYKLKWKDKTMMTTEKLRIHFFHNKLFYHNRAQNGSGKYHRKKNFFFLSFFSRKPRAHYGWECKTNIRVYYGECKRMGRIFVAWGVRGAPFFSLQKSLLNVSFEKMNIYLPFPLTQIVFDAIDSDQSGYIEFPEFHAFLCSDDPLPVTS